MKFSTNTAYILSASLFAAGMVGTLAWTKGGLLFRYIYGIGNVYCLFFS